MRGKRLSRDAALRVGAIGLVVVVAALVLPGLLSPPDPPPLPADIGLGPTGASGPVGPALERGTERRRKPQRKQRQERVPPVRVADAPEPKPRPERERHPPREPDAPAPPPPAPPAPTPAPAPAPAPAPPVYAAPAPAPAPPAANPAPGEFGP